MIAVVYTVLFMLGGAVVARDQLPKKSPLVRVWLGMSLGLLLEMALPALFAHFVRFSVAAHILAVIALGAIVAVSRKFRDKHLAAAMTAQDRRTLAAMALFCLPVTALSAYLQYTHMIMPAADGSLWCGQSTYGDLCMHLAFATSMRDMAFPPSYNLLAGTPMAYPYLSDSLSTSMMLLGMDKSMAMVFPGTLLMAMTYAGFMLMSTVVLGSRKKAVFVAALLFFFNGGLGFLYDFDMEGRDNFARVAEIFTGHYKTPANQPDLNLRFSNVIADLLIPQRALMAGWAMGIPALYLLITGEREKSMRQTVILALTASVLPLVHTHTFLALGLFSGGFYIGRLIVRPKDERAGILKRAGVYLAIVCVLGLPNVLGTAVRQTVEGGSLRFQFNWVNNSGGRGMIDGYLWFWIKNAGLPFVLMICACLDAKRRGYLDIVLGMAAIYVVAELILFQPNEYDNNKLFYIWYMFACVLAADYGSMIMQRMGYLRGRWVLCALFIFVSVFSGGLSIARECVSGYQLFNKNAVAAGEWIDGNTEKDAVFLTGQQHINPVCSLAGRQIVCGSYLYVYFHGLDYRQQEQDCTTFYADPENNLDILEKYGVDYVYVSDYERAEKVVNTQALDALFPVVYENRDVKVYGVRGGASVDGAEAAQ